MDPKKREDLLTEMRDLIDTFLVEILEEQGYPKDFSNFTGKPEMESFLDDIRKIFKAESENQVTLAHSTYCICVDEINIFVGQKIFAGAET